MSTLADLGRYAADVTPDAAAHVLWLHDDRRGFKPGSFTMRLLFAIQAADTVNLERLRRGFPAEVAAFQIANGIPAGLDLLYDHLRRELHP